MKPFSGYQHLEGEIMTDRDKVEVNSKFWNRGKWDNFVAPFLAKDCSGLTLVDMGCNAGLFLKYAQDRGFENAIGVDSDKEAVERGTSWAISHGGKYQIRLENMENCLDSLPVADYTVLANSHYYFYVGDWLDYLDKLRYKTRYCIIVTTEKRNGQPSLASADPAVIRRYLSDWAETGFIDALPTEGDPSPRKLYGLCFSSKIERVPIESLDCTNHVQDSFYGELDTGREFDKTRYFRILEKYRKNWTRDQLHDFMLQKIELYSSIKNCGLLRPLVVGDENRILDGNHRYSILRHLGYTSTLIRRV